MHTAHYEYELGRSKSCPIIFIITSHIHRPAKTNYVVATISWCSQNITIYNHHMIFAHTRLVFTFTPIRNRIFASCTNNQVTQNTAWLRCEPTFLKFLKTKALHHKMWCWTACENGPLREEKDKALLRECFGCKHVPTTLYCVECRATE